MIESNKSNIVSRETIQGVALTIAMVSAGLFAVLSVVLPDSAVILLGVVSVVILAGCGFVAWCIS